jgi:hypothetical protein
LNESELDAINLKIENIYFDYSDDAPLNEYPECIIYGDLVGQVIDGFDLKYYKLDANIISVCDSDGDIIMQKIDKFSIIYTGEKND